MRLRDTLKRNKILLENFSYLSILQLLAMASPLLTYPYLLRLFGFKLYGTIIFAQVIATNIAILINYGFNLSGTHAIATHHAEKEKLSEIVSSVFEIKVIIWVFLLGVYSVIVYNCDYFNNYRALYIVSYLITLNDVLLPIWYFQGIEKMKFITYINAATRLLFIVLIFVFVRTPGHYMYVPMLNVLGAFVGGLAAIIIVFRNHGIIFKLQKKVVLKSYFVKSTPFFVSALSVNIYANISKLVVGTFLGKAEVAIYDMAEKMTSILKIPAGIISQASFPRICKVRKISYVNKLMFVSFIGLSILYLICFVLADKIVFVLSGEHIALAANIMRILTFTAVCAVVNGFFGSNRLVVWGYEKTYMRVAMLGCFVYIALVAFLYISDSITMYSIAVVPLVAELSIALTYIILAKKYNLLTAH